MVLAARRPTGWRCEQLPSHRTMVSARPWVFRLWRANSALPSHPRIARHHDRAGAAEASSVELRGKGIIRRLSRIDTGVALLQQCGRLGPVEGMLRRALDSGSSTSSPRFRSVVSYSFVFGGDRAVGPVRGLP
jgi:hypothetical protein